MLIFTECSSKEPALHRKCLGFGESDIRGGQAAGPSRATAAQGRFHEPKRVQRNLLTSQKKSLLGGISLHLREESENKELACPELFTVYKARCTMFVLQLPPIL